MVRRKEGVPLCELKDWVRCHYQESRNGNKTLIAAGLCIQDNTKKPDGCRDPGYNKTPYKGPKCNLCQAMGRDPNHWLRECTIMNMSNKQQLKQLSYCLACLRLKPKSPVVYNCPVYLHPSVPNVTAAPNCVLILQDTRQR